MEGGERKYNFGKLNHNWSLFLQGISPIIIAIIIPNQRQKRKTMNSRIKPVQSG